MNPNPWLIAIVPVILAAVLGAVLSPSMARAGLALARARAQRVKYVPVSGTYLLRQRRAAHRRAVPGSVRRDQRRPRPAVAARRAQRVGDEQQYAAFNRFSVLAGMFPHAHPIRSNADDAWAWY